MHNFSFLFFLIDPGWDGGNEASNGNIYAGIHYLLNFYYFKLCARSPTLSVTSPIILILKNN